MERKSKVVSRALLNLQTKVMLQRNHGTTLCKQAKYFGSVHYSNGHLHIVTSL